ncbi:MAG TPA: sugar phosphate isomerase/epimerase family protein, partial [Chitinophagaceae bacterium]|nr:sugar phosphate isomerase/epimerase family protein [Chitinophagaceae bacterium]
MNRRQLLYLLGASTGAALLPRSTGAVPSAAPAPGSPFVYCLNMATIRGHKLGFLGELEVASRAGFRSVEIWMDTLQAYLKGGGTLAEARRRMSDLGITAENAIGFAEWIVDDEDRRRKGIDQLKREMEQLAAIGCKRTAAPPMGATQQPGLSLAKAAERYRAILELGRQTGVTPHLELWGFSQNLGRLSEVLYVAVESGHPDARVVLDIYHLYKGGSSVETLPLVRPQAVDILHMNDYTKNTAPATITDADRIFPGEGVAPTRRVLEALRSPERPLILSVEVFNKEYYAQQAGKVAATALARLKQVT